MRSIRIIASAVLALTVVAASGADAQQRRPAQRTTTPAQGYWELGTDAALQFGLDDPNTTVLSIPSGAFRAGYFMTPEWSLEPFLSLTYVSVDGGGSTTAYQIGTGALYHFSTSRTMRQVYVRPFLALVGLSVDPPVGAGSSDSDVALGAGVGLKWPRLAGRMAWRGEVNVARQFDAQQTSIGLLFGVSFFTR